MCDYSANSYVHISSWYDQMMSHVDYKKWAGYLKKILKEHSVSPSSILELGAGTCQHARHLDFGPDVKRVHSDLSWYMLKNTTHKDPFHKVVCDMRELPFKPGFNLVLMLYDAFNYLLDESEVKETLWGLHDIIDEGGYFLFDITTDYNSRTYFYNETVYEDLGEMNYVRMSWYEQEERFQHNDFIYYIKNDENNWKRIEENHLQRVYSSDMVYKWLEECGFKKVAAYSGLSMNTPGPRSLRIHILAQKQ